MDVELIEMPKAEARARLKSYRTALHRRADAEYEAAAAGYAELAKGRALINVADALRQAPRDEKQRPMLAIARADRKQVQFKWRRYDGAGIFDTSLVGYRSGSGMEMRFDLGEFPFDDHSSISGYSLVPMVPAQAKAEAGNPQMRKCFILWEVEAWADRSIRAVPDRDPFLLRHIGGDLYSVLAAWDLTELERAVMSRRNE